MVYNALQNNINVCLDIYGFRDVIKDAEIFFFNGNEGILSSYFNAPRDAGIMPIFLWKTPNKYGNPIMENIK